MVYSEGMPKRLRSEFEGSLTSGDPITLTINQVVSINLARARRTRGWTQEETAARLEEASGKKWTAATLSASEGAVRTGRPRSFDANELVTFARVFDFPVAYFLLPLDARVNYVYALTKVATDADEPVMQALQKLELLKAAVPLRYPASMVDAVNSLLRAQRVSWRPDATLDWDDGSDGHDDWLYLTQGMGETDVTLDELDAIRKFAEIVKNRPTPKVLRLLADAMDEPSHGGGTPLEDPPF